MEKSDVEYYIHFEAVVRRCSSKYMFLKFRKFYRKAPVLES